MEDLVIEYYPYAAALPPRPIRLAIGGWSGAVLKMEDGSDPQPWHCLPFTEASTYGLELVYPYQNECHVINDGGAVRFEWDYASEPAGVTGGEFVLFSPVKASKYYLFNTRLDIQTPPGYVVRTEPHPRFFTDDTGTVPCSMIGHLQNEWYPRLTFVVFRAPRPGQRHIFRKGEPFAQIIFVPTRAAYDIKQMAPEKAAQRRELEQAIQRNRFEIAENRWRHPDGVTFNNHYKLLARAFARDGIVGVEQLVREGGERHDRALPKDADLEKSLAQGTELLDQKRFEQAQEVFLHILSRYPQSADALNCSGICFACMGNMMAALKMMTEAVSLQPGTARFHTNLGELYRRIGRLADAETSLRASLQLRPRDPEALGLFGLILVQQGKVGEGIEAYHGAAAVAPPMPAPHVQMGLALAQKGQVDEARQCFQAALAIAPDYAPALRAMQELPA